LRKLAGNNANPLKPEQSKDFIKIEAVLRQLRIQEQRRINERRVFKYIKHLILFEAEDEEPKTIREILKKISVIFTENVDKNGENYR
jgi:hypothetical protein